MDMQPEGVVVYFGNTWRESESYKIELLLSLPDWAKCWSHSQLLRYGSDLDIFFDVSQIQNIKNDSS